MPQVTVIPGDGSACGLYRMRWPAEAAQQAGADVTVLEPREWMLVPDTDVLVIQRPMIPRAQEYLAGYRRRGISVVVDIDDAFWAIHPRNISWQGTHPRQSQYHFRHMEQWARGADLVTVTTPALAAHYRGRLGVRVLPNRIPASALEVGRHALEQEPQEPVVGWAGFVATHPEDLREAAGAMKALECMHVLGHPWEHETLAAQLAVPKERVKVTGPAPLDEYQAALAAFQVGLVPLRDSAFNRAKSALKMLEYAAAGAYPLASATPDNQRLASEGIGEVVWKPKEWARALSRLKGEALAQARQEAWEAAHAQTIEGNLEQWLDAWAASRGGRQQPPAAVSHHLP
jgi:hypothetical protein